MLAFHSPDSVHHDPTLFFRRGTLIPHPERAERYVVLHDAAEAAGHELIAAGDHGLDPILATHDRDYVGFLRTAWDRSDEFPGTENEILTGHFARPQMHRKPVGFLGLLGYYLADTSTPIAHGTWAAIYGSAQAAVSAAQATLSRGRAYALCRPPGHHAYRDSAGGFCYLNNTAIGAEALLRLLGAPVAVLDIDVHHGNGTQSIFYARRDVVTASIHADPANYFPFYAGYADERGEGMGDGFNRNLPIAQGSDDRVWLEAVAEGTRWLMRFRPCALIVALGLDASEEDPIGALRVTSSGFSKAGEAIAQARLPTLVVQEGGYLCAALPRNLISFLNAFEAAAG